MTYYFDLDSTLIDTRKLRAYRRNVEGRNWITEHPDRFETSLVNPKLPAIIRALKNQVVIITNSPQDYAEALLRKHGFPEIPVRGSANKPCSCFHLPYGSIYIGDEPRDILYGHEEKVGTIAYTEKGFFSEKCLEKSLPSATAKTISQLEKLLSEKLMDEPRDLRSFTVLSEKPQEEIKIHALQDYYPNSRDKAVFKKTNSGDILSYKRTKDCTWEEIKGGYRDSFVFMSEGVRKLANGKSYFGIVKDFCRKLDEKIKSLNLSGSVKMVAIPNSLPEFAYLCDINYIVASEFNKQKSGRTLYRVNPVNEAHSTGSRNFRKHLQTLAIHRRPDLDLETDNIILFDDITTTGTQFNCATALLRGAGYKKNIVGLALGKTILN
ncbi:MAG: hypothetical protein Q8L27_03410 [archaeon]|nr:hypothetical protein [archaeon]